MSDPYWLRLQGLAHEKQPCVYILASRRNRMLYTGVSNDGIGRVSIHKQDLFECFAKRYGVHRLLCFELHDTMEAAIRREKHRREKQLKRWRREWKVALIEKDNPEWNDLYWELSGFIDA